MHDIDFFSTDDKVALGVCNYLYFHTLLIKAYLLPCFARYIHVRLLFILRFTGMIEFVVSSELI